jgi:hypothetical protein
MQDYRVLSKGHKTMPINITINEKSITFFELVVVVVHIDDCTIGASTIHLIMELKDKIHTYIEITDLGELHWLLGIKVTWNHESRTLSLSQKSYLDSII